MRRLVACALFLVLGPFNLTASFLRPLPQVSRPKQLVIIHVTVIDATGAPARADMTVTITGDRITAIDKRAKAGISPDAQVLNGSGQYLIPGLWDMHVHALSAGRHVFLFPIFIANGITGIRDMGTTLPLEQVSQLRSETANGKILGPRVVAAGPIVDGPKPIWPFSLAVATETEAREAVDMLKREGADFVKVYNLVPRPAYFAIADEARKQGLPFVGHVPISVTAAEASDAGQKSIEHLNGLLLACSTDEAEIMNTRQQSPANFDRVKMATLHRAQARQLLKTFNAEKEAALFQHFLRNGTWQTPTLVALRMLAYWDDASLTSDPRLKYVPLFIKREWTPGDDFRFHDRSVVDVTNARLTYQKSLELTGAMRRAGVKILAGTDFGNPYILPGFSLHDELGLLVKAGLTPMEALQSATRNPAEFLGTLDQLGTVETGKIADLVLLRANPLTNIANTQKIEAVIIGGRLLDQSELRKMLASAATISGPQ
ncbi:MAG TPA: amidohydrolase family protein [Pyrinomonadaceae bacterium]|nr:amidohydrolase family protein [Pyrinomonadaceae bacterium]